MALGANYRLSVYSLQCALVGLCLAAPLGLALRLLPQAPLAWPCVTLYLLPTLIMRRFSRHSSLPRAAWAMPLGFAAIGLGMLRSLLTYVRDGGIRWRGNLYALADLRAGQRVSMGALLLP